jgi:hypothetical protein
MAPKKPNRGTVLVSAASHALSGSAYARVGNHHSTEPLLSMRAEVDIIC